ncbi:MAG: hypothetical protein EPO40_14500 [Myxococcaceae bacterium]|nr:MAG: hypothetical protein EPO40_14500 [Myxococcaceae bacterium]
MSYRNDVEALQIRLSQLEQELAGIRDERARLERAARSEPRLITELDAVRRELHARAPRRLPMLDDIRVASPCHERWDAMTGDEQSRFCGSCRKNVYNLSAMTREAAEALVRSKEGDLCVRYFRRTDGTILTADCPVGVRRKRVQLVAAAGAVTALAAGAVAFAFARMGSPVPTIAAPTVAPRVAPPVTAAPVPLEEIQGQMVQGDIAPRMGTPVVDPAPVHTRPRMGRPMMRQQR